MEQELPRTSGGPGGGSSFLLRIAFNKQGSSQDDKTQMKGEIKEGTKDGYQKNKAIRRRRRWMETFFCLFVGLGFGFFISFHSPLRLKLPACAECGACMCARHPESIFCMCKQMFGASLARGQSLLHLCRLFSPFTSICSSGAMWVTPASQRRRRGIGSPRKQWSPLHPDNAEGDPPAPDRARLAAKPEADMRAS